MEEKIMYCLKKLDELEKKIERYFKILQIKNELDFIMKGGYIINEDIENLMNGEY